MKDFAPGAERLFRECVGAGPGSRVLLVHEPAGSGYFDDAAADRAALAARAMGIEIEFREAPPGAEQDELMRFAAGLADARRAGAEHVVFFARIGDQLRFAALPDAPPATMVYAIDAEMLDTHFTNACHCGLCELAAMIDAALDAAAEVRVTCPRGTDYVGHAPEGLAPVPNAPADTTLRRFPQLMHRPMLCDGFSGRVVLSRFLIGTGSHFYQPYWRPLNEDVVAHVEGRRLVRFTGTQKSVDAVNAHYEDIAKRYGADPWAVHSWHCGIHPGCAFRGDAYTQMERWAGAAFGNPRLLHFHTCGNYAPGEISWNIVDPTILVDGVALWEDGRLNPVRAPGGKAWAAAHPQLAALFDAPCREIGLGA